MNTRRLNSPAIKTVLVAPYVPMKKFYGAKYEKYGAVLPPYGLACIASYMEKCGFAAHVLDANRLKLSAPQAAAKVQELGGDIVGIYSTTLGISEALELASAVRQLCPKAKIALGGPHAISMKGQILRASGALDFSCWGEGELAMAGLAGALAEGNDNLDHIDGLCWRRGKDIVENPINRIIKLDDIPSPSSRLGSLAGYRQKIFSYLRTPFAVLQTSRGCPYQCVFCSSPNYLQSIQGGRIRTHGIGWIDEQLDYLVNRQGAREIYFLDDTFNLNANKVSGICELISRKYPDLVWSCNFEVSSASFEMLRQMRDAGCWSIMIGVESGSPDILKTINKDITVDQVVSVSDWCHELGLMGRASFIIGHPGETADTIRETISLAKRIRVPFVSFSLMTPLPGSDFFKVANKYGDWKYDTDTCSLSTASFAPFGLTRETLQNLQADAHRQVYFNIHKNIALTRYLGRKVNREFFSHAVKRFFLDSI